MIANSQQNRIELLTKPATVDKDGGAATANNGQDSLEDSGTVDEQARQQETLAKDPEEEKKPSESADPSQSAEAEVAGPSASNEPSTSLSWIVNSARAVVDTARNILSINTQGKTSLKGAVLLLVRLHSASDIMVSSYKQGPLVENWAKIRVS